MLRNYFKTAIRNLKQNKFFTAINILGLAIGIASCLFITIYVVDELSFDKFHTKSEQIFRIRNEVVFGGVEGSYVVSPAPMAQALIDEFPEVEEAGRLRTMGPISIQIGEDFHKEGDVTWADQSILNIFDFDFVAGNISAALTNPNTMVISQRAEGQMFSGESGLGKSVSFNGNEYEVTGVYRNIPTNSHFEFDMMLSMEGNDESRNVVWLSNNFHTYFVLQQGTDYRAFEDKLILLLEKYVEPQIQQFLGMSGEEVEKAGGKLEYFVQPLTEIHLHSNFFPELKPNGNISYVYIFIAVALFTLLIATINFMNLSTAKSSNRSKEIGVRKVLGSFKKQLIAQFLVESLIVTFAAFLIALGFVELFIDDLSNLAGKRLSFSFFSDWSLMLGIFSAALILGILAGSYPAFYMSAFSPINILKNNLNLGLKGGRLRSSLVVIQFFISTVLIIGTIGVYKQLQYIQNKSLGFNKENVIIVDDAYILDQDLQAFRNKMLQENDILSATVSSFLPVDASARSDNSYFKDGVDIAPENAVSMQSWQVDHNYVETMKIDLIEGRDFELGRASDSAGVILNRRAAELFNYEGGTVGKRIVLYSPSSDGGINTDQIGYYNIIGVIDDFHYNSMKEPIGPLALFIDRGSRGSISFRVESNNIQSTIAKLEAGWEELSPSLPFSFRFLDAEFDDMYRAEARVGKLVGIFSILAIFIACLGLFALSSFTAEKKKKEIGVRKVLGASVGDVVVMLSKDFSKLVLIAFLLGAPMAWFLMNNWLQNFQYKTNIGVEIFILAGLVSFLVSWLTISFQSLRAANANPVNSLRSE
ncbi:MAG: FtsX-like permease family protein [Bacteroidota bacterium]